MSKTVHFHPSTTSNPRSSSALFHRDYEFKVVWRVATRTRKDESFDAEAAQVVTFTYPHIPPLAQDVPEEVAATSSFGDPLHHLNLEEEGDEAKEPENPLKRAMDYFYSTSRISTESGGSKIPKRFLRTPPDRYLPIPPLIRTPYYYSYGRCPICAGNATPFDHEKRKVSDHSLGRASVKTIENSTKDGPLEHLVGKTKQRVENIGRHYSVYRLHSRVSEVKRISVREFSLKLDGGYRKSTRFTEDAINVLYNGGSSLPTFVSAKQLRKRPKTTCTNCRSARSDLTKFTPRYQIKPHVKDLSDAYPGGVILASKLKDYDCHIPLIGVDTETIREVYTATILKDHVLKRLYHRKNFKNLPPDLKYLQKINFLDFVQARSWMTMDNEIDKDRYFHNLTTNNCCSVLDEIANQFYECDFAELHVFTNWLDSARSDDSLLQLKTCKEISRLVGLLGDELVRANAGLAGTSRMELLIVLATAIGNRRLRTCLWTQVRGWLDPLIGGLFAPSKCVREETCYTLAYLFSINTLVDDLRHLLSYDVPYDVTYCVLKAIDIYPDTFMTYYLLLGYMIEGCPNFCILSCIMERAVNSSNAKIRKRWPLLVYYAVKFWHISYLTVDLTYFGLLEEKLARSAMNLATRKPAKMALVALAHKFDRPVAGITHFNSSWLRRDEDEDS